MARWQWNGLNAVLDPWLAESPPGDRQVLEALAQLLDHADLDLGATIDGLPLARRIEVAGWVVTFLRVEQFHTFRLVSIRPAVP